MPFVGLKANRRVASGRRQPLLRCKQLYGFHFIRRMGIEVPVCLLSA
jgi:hypothetical protein